MVSFRIFTASVRKILVTTSYLAACILVHTSNSECASNVMLSNIIQFRGVQWLGDDSHFLFRQKLLGEDGSVRGGVVMAKQTGLFLPKFGATSSHVFKQSPQNFAVDIAFPLSCLFGLGDVGLM